MFSSALSIIPWTGFDRWLISNKDIPEPGNETKSFCASRSTGAGRVAGPAAKL
jgi:hypothetical protein